MFEPDFLVGGFYTFKDAALPEAGLVSSYVDRGYPVILKGGLDRLSSSRRNEETQLV